MLAIDISNYTSPLTPENLAALKATGVGHVIVQAVDPPSPYPPGVTRKQIEACLAAGFSVDAYVYLWFSLDVSEVQSSLALLDGLSIRRIWLDVEDQGAAAYQLVANEAQVATALAACDAFPVTGSDRAGIYTGSWFWATLKFMANSTAFADRDLWDAHFDGIADTTAGFNPYGGWDHVTIKQYGGTDSVAGITRLDQDVLSDAEAAKIIAPKLDPCAGLINGLAYVADTLGDALLAECQRANVRKSVIRAQVAEMQRVRVQQVGPRP